MKAEGQLTGKTKHLVLRLCFAALTLVSQSCRKETAVKYDYVVVNKSDSAALDLTIGNKAKQFYFGEIPSKSLGTHYQMANLDPANYFFVQFIDRSGKVHRREFVGLVPDNEQKLYASGGKDIQINVTPDLGIAVDLEK